MGRVSRIGQAVLIAVAVYCALTVDALAMIPSVILDGRYVGDFTVFWTAVRVDPSIVYDLEAISRAQAPLLGGFKGARPFVNPPSFLPWLEPFGALPLLSALALWVALGLTAFAAACRGLVSWRHIPLVVVAPCFVLGVVTGQVSFFIAAAVIAAVTQLKSRPVLAGALFALAATIKPQAVLLAPLAMVAGAHWRALIASAVTGLAIGGACVLIQGPELWLQWWGALEGFVEISQRYYLMKRGATPSSLAYLLGLSGVWAGLLIGAGAILGIAVVIAVFRAPEDVPNRIAALVAGGILCAPYAMPPAAIPLLIPASLWLLGSDRRLWLPGFLMISHLMLPVAVIVVAITAFLKAGGWRRLVPARA